MAAAAGPATTTAARPQGARNPAVKRIVNEYQELLRNPSTDFSAAPLEDNMFEWHFTIKGPPDSPFEGGRYHGRILLPSEYPYKPPDIVMMTPSGRFEVNTKICLSNTGFHPQSWQPGWGVRTVLVALIPFMTTKGKGAIGALEFPDADRRALAEKSALWVCPVCQKRNCDFFQEPGFVGPAAGLVADQGTPAPRLDEKAQDPASVNGEADREKGRATAEQPGASELAAGAVAPAVTAAAPPPNRRPTAVPRVRAARARPATATAPAAVREWPLSGLIVLVAVLLGILLARKALRSPALFPLH